MSRSGRPRVVAVGLGPAGPSLTSPAASRALASAPWPVLRTRRHPSAEGLPYPSFDELYERATSFEALYEEIVDAVATAAFEHGEVAYGVPGSPLVLERTVELLRTRQEVELEVIPAMSFCDLAWARLGIDPVATGVRLVDGESFAAASSGGGPLLVGQCWSRSVLSEIKLAPEDDGPETATILYHLGLHDEQVIEVSWADVDRAIEPDHLTTLYIPALGSPAGSELVKVAETVRILRERCPWDREQTHRSLVRHLVEETYEAIEAIEAIDPDPTAEQAAHLEEELGDLLCQVLFHSTLAAEEGLFQLSDVAAGLRTKLVSRHPHVFAGASADTSAHVVAGWERRKLAEKGRTSLMEGIPTAMPALALAAKVERKATGAQLGWEVTGDDGTLRGLLDEVLGAQAGAGAHPTEGAGDNAAIGADRAGTGNAGDDALGELLLGLACRAAASGVDPEAVLRGAVARFRARFVAVEEVAALSETSLHDLPAERRIALWEAAEHRSRL